MGHSWGTVIGLNIARAHPEWLHAYIGMGQVINGPENERVGYAFALREARRSGNALAVSELEAIAPYPGPEGSLSLQRSEEHTSELQSLMRISYAVFCLKKKTKTHRQDITTNSQNK